ncbi:hypothetical protein M231_02357 [Tremella mesenterica]|uniref:Retrovirus-related Pol polyprotein from transposon TNT 1-94-like beta-barrel domain-containing protein n=1 Tax=Tremella mesenterica TaxID=5217 RepID=A0A4Q1BQZ5_TREME|nr:hypothetical protein M231_02357 [Tremella mesenterica]
MAMSTESWFDDDEGYTSNIVWPEEIENPWVEDNEWVGLATESNDISHTRVIPTWVVDSGATHHITPHRLIMTNIQRLVEPRVFGLASGKSMTAWETGDINLELDSGQKMVLKDVHHIPTAKIQWGAGKDRTRVKSYFVTPPFALITPSNLLIMLSIVLSITS